MDNKSIKPSDKKMDNRSIKPSDKKERKKVERHDYRYDAVIMEVRKVSPCNRTTFRNVAVEFFINSHRDAETGKLEAEGINRIAGYVVELRPKKVGKEIKGVSI